MSNFLRNGLLLAVVFCFLSAASNRLLAQCVGLPTVATLGSNKVPAGFCSPVKANVSYNVSFLSPVPAGGTIAVFIDWGDGTTQTINKTTGQTSYTVNEEHTFPENSDCEFLVTISLRYNGQLCANTRQIQKIASWRTDAHNGGNVLLASPTNIPYPREHLVCEGERVDVIFRDATQYNCNAAWVHIAPQPIETPNLERRWQQIVYNTGSGPLIPNLTVNGVAITNASGGTLAGRANYQDPRGVVVLPVPVVAGNGRNSLRIEAPGGFGPGFPKVGDVFQVTLRYWNYCNPYDDPNIAGPPANLNLGDNAPVEQTSIIRIVAAPNPPTAGDQTVCNGTTPSAFEVGGVPANHLVSFYRDNAGVIGTRIGSESTSRTLNVTSHPDWAGNTTGRVYKVWARYRSNTQGSCLSPPVLITRTVRARPAVANPTTAPPAEICNRNDANNQNTFQIVLPAPATEAVGGATEYVWNTTLPSGITVASSNATSATYNVNVSFGANELYVDRSLTITRRFTTNPTCGVNRTFNIRIYNTAVGGTPSAVPDVCQTTPVGTITLSGHRGQLMGWEYSLNGAAYQPYTGPSSGNSITPGILSPGTYQFRAIVRSGSTFSTGPCGPVRSAIETVVVSVNPAAAETGPNQAFCETVFPAVSTPLGGNDPGAGTGVWTFVSSFPSGLPAPAFTANDRNTTITVSSPGAYVMRWTVTNGSCTSFDDITVDFGGNPTDPEAGDNRSVCGITTNMEGNTPIIGFGEWTLVNSPPGGSATITNPGTANATVQLNAPHVYGTYTFRWTITSGTCASEQDEVELTFYEIPNATASDIATVCIGPTTFDPIPLSGTISGGVSDGVWQNVNGNGVVSATTLSGGNYVATYTPTIDDYNAGTPIRVKLIANPVAGSPCTPDEQEIVINIDRKPNANAGVDIPNICEDEVQLNAQNPPPFGATGVWTTAGSISFDNNTLPNTWVRNLPIGTTSVTWTLTSASGLCVSDPATIDLTRVALPSPAPQMVLECEMLPPGGPITTAIVLTNYEDGFGAGVPAAGNREVTWYRNAPDPVGSQVMSPSVAETNISSGQLYFAKIRDLTTSCHAYGQLTINVRALPPAADATISVCETDPTNDPGNARNIDLSSSAYTSAVIGSSTTVGIRWFPTFMDAQNETNEILTPVDVIGNMTVHARVVYTDMLPACPDFAEVQIKVNAVQSITDIGGDPTVCMGESGAPLETLPINTYQVPSIPGAKYYWNVPQGAGEYVVFGGGGESDFFVLLKFPYAPSPPPLPISVQIDYNGCTTAVIDLPIIRGEVPTAPVVIGDAEVCENTEAIRFNVDLPDPGSNYIWEIRRASDGEIGGAFIASGQTTPEIFINFSNENVNISVSERNGECPGPETIIPVMVNRLPTMDNMSLQICSQNPTGVTLSSRADSPVPATSFNIRARVEDAGLTQLNPLPAIPDLAVGATRIQNDIFVNKTGGALNVNYTVSPVSTKNCPGVSKIISVQVNPEPQMEANLGRELCSNDATNVVLRTAAGKASADQYIIASIDNPDGLAGVGIPAAGSTVDENGIRTNRWENLTGTSSIIRYNIQPRNSITTCVGETVPPVEFTIHPKPIFASVVNPAEICSETHTNISIGVTNIPTANINWTLDYVGSNILGATAGSSLTPPAHINDVLRNNSRTAVDLVRYRIVAVNKVSNDFSCASDALVLQVNVNPLPAVTPPTALETCADAPLNGLRHTTDLTTLNNTISSPATTSVVWYDADPTIPASTPIGTPAAWTVQHNVPVYALVTNNVLGGCSDVVPVTYSVNEAVSFGLTKTDVTCAGSGNGSLRVDVTTGTGPFNFQINTAPKLLSGTPFTFGDLNAGAYTITVEDSKGCSASDNSQVITEPAQLTAAATHVDASCYFDASALLDRNGSIAVSANGGPNGTYNYTLVPAQGQHNTPGQFTNLPKGIYIVRVTDGPCVVETLPIEIGSPPPMEVLNPGSLELSCYGQNDGEIFLTARGGTGSYTFTNVQTSQTILETENNEARFTGLAPGVYTITTVDGNGCRTPQTALSIAPVFDFTPGQIGSSADICPEQTPLPLNEVVEPFGGSNSFEYLWQFSFTGSANDPENDLQWSSIGSYSSLAAAKTLDPAATLDPNRSQPEVRYRRLVRAIPTRVNPACLIPKSSNLVTLRPRPEPVVQIVAPASVCEGIESFIYLQMETGTAPMTFDVFDGDILMVNQSGGTQSPLYAIKNAAQTPTLYFDNIRDTYGCKTGKVEHYFDFQAKPSFTVVNPQQCAEQEFEFMHTPDPNLQYQWIFGDGSTPETYFGDNPPTLPIKHTYPAGSTSVNTQYTVKLTAFGACPDHSFSQQVTIFPTIARNIIEPETNICDGETVTFTDNSAGVTSSTWQYQYVDDNGDVITSAPIVPAGPQVQFSLPNATNQNPVAYTILYNAQNNQGCGTSQTLGPVKVYKTPVASFTNLPAEPEMIGGVMEVEYAINDYAPAFFNYSWIDPGMHLVPGSESFDAVNGVRTIQYAREEDITITLVVANALMPRCASQDIQIIPIKLNSPTAGFVATPLVGCFPVTVTTQNTSVSFDQFEWVLTSAHSNEERSMLREPQFRISQPGVYTLTMLARKTGTTVPPQYATPRTITVFEQPYADFLLRMPQVFLGEPVEPINRSLFAQSFLWDFGDGETSIEIQPRHTYRLEGKDSITLIAYFDHGAFDLDGDGIIDGNVVCADTTKQAIRIIAGGALKIPNAFTPSANGPNSGHEDLNFTNDVFLPIMDGVEEFTMQIYDRWGTLVFESRDKNIGWNGYDRNGRLMPAGVYVYKLVLRLGDGQRTTQVGDVTLIR